MNLPLSEITFLNSNLKDSLGRVFIYRNEYYRAIKAEKKDEFLSFFNSEVYRNLSDSKFIQETKLTNYFIEDYPLVLKYQNIPFLTYPYEWSDKQFIDLYKRVLEINSYLISRGYIMYDIHTWNFTFDGANPILLDIGAISRKKKNCLFGDIKNFYFSFRNHYLRRLKLIRNSQGHAARAAIYYSGNVQKSDLPIGFIRYQIDSFKLNLLKKLRESSKSLTRTEAGQEKEIDNSCKTSKSLYKIFIYKLINKVTWDSLKIFLNFKLGFSLKDNYQLSNWKKYYNRLEGEQLFQIKKKSVYEILKNIPKCNIIDLGSNSGYFTFMANSFGHKVLSVDSDSLCIEEIFKNSKDINNKITTCLSFVHKLDVAPSRHLLSPSKRWKCDVIIALALVHHVVTPGFFNYSDFIRLLLTFNPNLIILEHVPTEEKGLNLDDDKLTELYMKNNLVIKNSYPSYNGRRIYLLSRN